MTDADTDIRPLDDATVERIAAGEVVERPASAVKELVENSLDAGASRVDVEVAAGGTERVRVADDGRGMTEADVRAAVRPHTTSKIRDVADLEAGVDTLGFRGEALHTIGAVSKMAITTRRRGAEGAGTKLRYVGGEVEEVTSVGCPAGTAVEVTDLFFNTPARRKYLGTEATEFTHVNRVVTRYALANPGVAVSLSHDGRRVFATTGDGDLRATVLAVYGREVAESMREVEWERESGVSGASDGAGGGEGASEDVTDDGAAGDGAAGSGSADEDGEGENGGDEDGSVADDDPAADGPLAAVSGLVSHPETNRSSREYVSTFVNGRAVRSAAVREAVLSAYGDQLAADRYPFAVLFLDADPAAVDVNVHPRKQEVRFDDAAAVRRGVCEAVTDALLSGGLVRSAAPRGRSAPDETAVAPGSAGEGSGPDGETGDGSRKSGTGDGEPTDGEATAEPGDASTTADGTGGRAATAGTGAEDAPPAAGPGGAPGAASDGTDASGTGRAAGARKFAGPHRQARLGGDEAETARDGAADDGVAGARAGAAGERTSFDSLPPMRVLGQVHDTYVVAETPDGLVLVDQHAADERVRYEALRERFAGDTTAQVLADPVEVELTAGEAAGFEAHREALARLGFRAETVGGDPGRVAVRTVPAVLGDALDPATLRDVLADVLAADREGATTVAARADALLADLACYPAVTGNTPLTEGDVAGLLAALDDCDDPYACPHGRPVLVEVDAGEIEDRFERDYPGRG